MALNLDLPRLSTPRKLRPDARPVARPGDPFVISSAADCRLTVFRSVSSAHQLWIKVSLASTPITPGDCVPLFFFDSDMQGKEYN